MKYSKFFNLENKVKVIKKGMLHCPENVTQT